MRRFHISVFFLLWTGVLLAQKPTLIIPFGHTDAITCLDYAADGAYLLSGSKDRSAKLWNKQGRLLRTFSQHTAALVDVRLSPQQGFALTRTSDSIFVWRVDGVLVWKKAALSPPADPRVNAYDQPVFAADDRYLLTRASDSTAVRYDLINETSAEFPCDGPQNLQFSPDGQLILSSVGDSILLFNRQLKVEHRFAVENRVKAYFPFFRAFFLDNDRILIGFSFPKELGYTPQMINKSAQALLESGGHAKIYSTKGVLLDAIGMEPLVKEVDGVLSAGFEGVDPQTGEAFERYSPIEQDSFWMVSVGGPFYYVNMDNKAISTNSLMDWNVGILSAKADQLLLSYSSMTSLWNLSTKEKYLFNPTWGWEPGSVFPLGFSQDGKYIGLVKDGNVGIYDIEKATLTFLKQWNNISASFLMGSWPASVAFSPVANQLTIGYQNGRIATWNFAGQLLQEMGSQKAHQIVAVKRKAKQQQQIDLYYLRDKTSFGEASSDIAQDTFQLGFDLNTGEVTQQDSLAPNPFADWMENTAVSLDETYEFSSSWDPSLDGIYRGLYFYVDYGVFYVKALTSGAKSFNFLGDGMACNLGIWQDKYLFISYPDNHPKRYDFQALKKLALNPRNSQIHDFGVDVPAISVLKNELVTSTRIDSLSILPTRTQFLDFAADQPLVLIKKRDIFELESRNGEQQYVEKQFKNFQVYNFETESLVTFLGHPLKLLGAVFIDQGQYVLSWSEDHSCKIWDTATGQELLTLFWFDEKDWIVLAPNGLFDASPGVMNLLYYSVGTEIIELEQLKARFYEPGLLPKLLGYSDERIRPVEAFDEVNIYPKVFAEIREDSLHIRLQERKGGIGRVNIFINGKEVAEDANPLARTPPFQRDSLIHYDLKQHKLYLLRHPDSTNIISIRAYNAEGWLKSAAIKLEYRPTQRLTKGSDDSNSGVAWEAQLDPKLYVISVGTSDYTGTKLDLQYADQDATMMARALQAIGSALFNNGDSLEVYVLTTAQATANGVENSPIQWAFANKANIKATFDAIKRKAKAEDVIVVYFSGHGVTYGSAEQAQFHYLTQGIASDDLSDAAIRRAYTISSEEITQWINNIPALKQVLIIDACNSGQIVENLTGSSKALNSSQIRALDRMKDRTGMFILSGSASDKVSYEASEYGQGLLTYALLQGMLGVATSKIGESDYIDVMKLFQYARDLVPELAASINGIQTPMMGFPGKGASFDIGILDEVAKLEIPIGNKKPVVVRSTFLNKATFQDDLQLAALLEAAFRAETEKAKDADLIYVDVYNYPGAYAVNGLYEIVKGTIKIEAKLSKDRKDSIDLSLRSTDDPKQLVRSITREVKRVLKKSGI
ncbi:MAG: caspase family protein [Saprospiraceae bacterium]